MVWQKLTGIVTGTMVAFSVLAIAPLAAETAQNKYFCAVLHGTPRTFARTERGNIMMLSWKHQASDWTPLKRCVEVSQRFQRFYENGILRYIGTGQVNQEPVLCAVKNKGDDCNSFNVLVTLPPGTDARVTAQQLLDTRGLARGREIFVSGDNKVEDYINGNSYYNLETIENIVIEKEDSVDGEDKRIYTEELTPVESVSSNQ